MTEKTIIDHGATFNEARTHRQRLWRTWNNQLPALVCIGMNPSVADEVKNDPTVERTQRRAMMLGYGGLVMLNIMDVVETDSTKLDPMPAHERCTGDNSAELCKAIRYSQEGRAEILCAWGKPGQKYGAVAWLTTQAYRAKVTLFCLGTNKDGSPKHPLYQPYSKGFEWFGGVSQINADKPLHERLKLEQIT